VLTAHALNNYFAVFTSIDLAPLNGQIRTRQELWNVFSLVSVFRRIWPIVSTATVIVRFEQPFWVLSKCYFPKTTNIKTLFSAVFSFSLLLEPGGIVK
jgi:hypothetical protein